MRARVGFTAEFAEPKIAPAVRLPSTRQIDARIRRQTRTYTIWRTQYLRLKCDGGRWWAGPRPTKPPGPVFLSIAEDGTTLVFHRAPERRHPEGTDWIVPLEAVGDSPPIAETCSPDVFTDAITVLARIAPSITSWI